MHESQTSEWNKRRSGTKVGVDKRRIFGTNVGVDKHRSPKLFFNFEFLFTNTAPPTFVPLLFLVRLG